MMIRTSLSHIVAIHGILVCLLGFAASSSAFAQKPRQVQIDPDTGVLVVDGRKVFPIGLTMPPPPEGKTPDGRDGFDVLRKAGVTFIRSGPQFLRVWDDAGITREREILDAAARADLLCMPFLRELASVEDDEQEAQLRALLNEFKDHPGVGVWKGADEPDWKKDDIAALERGLRIVHEVDPNHPLWVVQAPRGTVESLKAYNNTHDIAGVDIYPIGYPPGEHSQLPNNDISVVGDHINLMRAVAGDMPVWATLQIAWSGVVKEGKTLRMPTFAQERYMAYQSIALGARGIIFFGGHVAKALPERDQPLQWNWTFYERVLEPLLAEIGDHSPLHPALVAPESTLGIRAADVEMCVREVGDEIFIIATYRHGDTKPVRFLGLPDDVADTVEVMFESPRTIPIERLAASDESPALVTFQDWFAPFDVHVYRLKRGTATTKETR